MISDVDEVLRELLIKEIEIKKNEVDIVFDTPKREWSARLSKPTINLFLFDIRENLRLRAAEQYSTVNTPDGNSEVRRNPVRLDLRYLMTAWTKEAEDEHLLLSRMLMGLLRNPFIPKDILTENLQTQPSPIPVEVATFVPEAGPVDKFTEIWGVLDNEIRPGILITVTISVDPYKPQVFPQVRTRETRFIQDTGFMQLQKTTATKVISKTYVSLGGKIESSKHDLSTLKMILVENKTDIEIDEDGNFYVHGLVEGEYHLDILFNKKVLKRQKIQVPAPDYLIEV
ncbi:MAG: DUF4255 domain-containing protein [Anaerolineaceae bacterium]|nr:DUF4255 domain-containing protein [Anaerolineaceae bacterium]